MSRLPTGVVLAAALACGCGKSSSEPPPPAPVKCNGHEELCSRRYDQVAYAGTHDSYSDTQEKFGAPDQTYPLARQLADGIRVLHLEIHVFQGNVVVCHSICDIGQKPLVDEMKAVHDFLAASPDGGVTLLLERSDATITADQISDAMTSAGLQPFMHDQAQGQPWPTLGEMVSRGDRLVALLDNTDGASAGWLLPRWQWTWETPWDNETAPDFGRCDADRGTKGNSLYVVDTYLEDEPIQSAQHALLVNYDPFLIDRVVRCQQLESTLPNFVMVNFYEVSDVFHVVDVLNGFATGPSDVSGFPPPYFEDGGGVAPPLPDAGAPDAG